MGVLLASAGLGMYLSGVVMALPRRMVGGGPALLALNEWLVWYSGVPLVMGLGLCWADLFLLLGHKRSDGIGVRWDALADRRVVVALTAYNDEDSIGAAVRDFAAPGAGRAGMVVGNNTAPPPRQPPRPARPADAARRGSRWDSAPLHGRSGAARSRPAA